VTKKLEMLEEKINNLDFDRRKSVSTHSRKIEALKRERRDQMTLSIVDQDATSRDLDSNMLRDFYLRKKLLVALKRSNVVVTK